MAFRRSDGNIKPNFFNWDGGLRLVVDGEVIWELDGRRSQMGQRLGG